MILIILLGLLILLFTFDETISNMKLQNGQRKLEFPPIGFKFNHAGNYEVCRYDTTKTKFCIVAKDEKGNEHYFQPIMFHTAHNSWKLNK